MKQSTELFAYSDENPETIETIYNLFNQGVSLQGIADHLDSGGVLTNAGLSWSKIKVYRVLEKIKTTVALEKLKEDQLNEFTAAVQMITNLNPLHRPLLPIDFLSNQQALIVGSILKNGLPPERDCCSEANILIPNTARDPNNISLLQRDVSDQKPQGFKELSRDQINARDDARTDGLMGMFNAARGGEDPTFAHSQPFPGKEGEDTTLRDKRAYAASILKIKNGIKTTIQRFRESQPAHF